MRHKSTGEYPDNWDEIACQVKEENDWKCERCGVLNGDPGYPGSILTVHHLDGNKSNNERWNLAALCQRCHLKIQGRVFLPQIYMFDHTPWFAPHVDGYYLSEYKKAIERYRKLRDMNPERDAADEYWGDLDLENVLTIDDFGSRGTGIHGGEEIEYGTQ